MEGIHGNQDKRERFNSLAGTVGDTAGGGARGGCGGKMEKLTYIVSSLAHDVLVQAARLAVAAPLVVLAVVPRRWSVGGRGGRRRAGGFLSVRLVFGVGPGRVESLRSEVVVQLLYLLFYLCVCE